MNEPLLVEQVRSGFVESVHAFDVAVVRDGVLVAVAGDPLRPAAFRSSAKPIQAHVAREHGWVPEGSGSLAIACASHSGDPGHVAAVRAVLAAAGLDDAALRCPEDLPFDPAAARDANGARRVTHNCSGKHASMLATCVAQGWPLETYRAADHPLQQAIAARMRELLGPAEVLTDGCGVPTFVAPLRSLASAFASIDGGPEAEAMRAHPHLVGGAGRFDTDAMTERPRLLVKSGAEGLTCISEDGLGIAMKARDGASRPRGPAAIAVLDAMGIALDGGIHREPPVLGGGEPVGALRVRRSVTPL